MEPPSTHRPRYQERDIEVIDYQMVELDGTGLWFRGTASMPSRPGIACLGAAQTFGCLAPKPFGELVADALRTTVLNLGYGGAGPAFYLRHPELLRRANSAPVVVLQVMSGRSESNALFDSGGLELLRRRSDGGRIGADDAYRELLYGRTLVGAGSSLPARAARRAMVLARRRRIHAVVAETRANWVDSYRELLSRLTVPTVLLWFSTRRPEYRERLTSVPGLFSAFPQLVTRAMVEAVAPLATSYVECTTNRGLPQLLVSRFSGEPVPIDPARDRPDLGGKLWTHNTYYPSPQMHADAAAALLPVCRGFLADEQ